MNTLLKNFSGLTKLLIINTFYIIAGVFGVMIYLDIMFTFMACFETVNFLKEVPSTIFYRPGICS